MSVRLRKIKQNRIKSLTRQAKEKEKAKLQAALNEQNINEAQGTESNEPG